MKVMYITHYNELYGANKSLLGLIKELYKYNVQPIVVCPKKGPLIEELTNLNIEYMIVPFKPWVGENNNKLKSMVKHLFNLYIAYRLKRIIKNKKIDIIHTNSSATNVGGLAAKMTKTKHIWHIREFLEEDYGLNFDLGRKKSISFINEVSDKVIFISNQLLKKYDKEIQNEKKIIIYNGIKPPTKDLNNYIKNKKNEMNILIVGILTKQKGQEEAILAIEHLNRVNGLSCKLNIVGDGPYYHKLKELVEKHKLEEIVTFWGYQEDVDTFYKKNDLLLMCSKSEAFGRTTIEAMLFGLPVIGANSGATSEIITDGKTGLLYKSGNFIDLANKVEILFNDRKFLSQLAIAGRENALMQFTSEKNAENIFSIYQQLE